MNLLNRVIPVRICILQRLNESKNNKIKYIYRYCEVLFDLMTYTTKCECLTIIIYCYIVLNKNCALHPSLISSKTVDECRNAI